MASINKVILIGNLGQDPETRYMANGTAVANFTLATSESWKDAQTGEQKEKIEWHRVTMYRRLAEIATEYLRKGSKVYIEGRLQTRKWQDKKGIERYTTEINANELQMLDSKRVNPEYNIGTHLSDSAASNTTLKTGEKNDNANPFGKSAAADEDWDDVPF